MINYFKLAGMVVAPALVLNISSTAAVSRDPFIPASKKALLITGLWLLPYVGYYFVRKALE